MTTEPRHLMMGLHVIIAIGDTGGVACVHGPFKTGDDAICWAHDNYDETAWCVMPLHAPEEDEDDSQDN